MIVLAVIRRNYKLLLIKTSIENDKEVWSLPYFEISDKEDPIDLLIDKCQIYNVKIKPIDIYFRDILSGREVICFDTHLLSYTYSSSSENAFWIPAINLEKLLFVDAFSVITDKLINEYRTALLIWKPRKQQRLFHAAFLSKTIMAATAPLFFLWNISFTLKQI